MDDVQPLAFRTGRLTAIFLAVVAVGLIAGTQLTGGGASGTTAGPMVGQVGPEVTVDLFDGGAWRLSEHLATDGRPVILNLWASWCEPCRREIPELTAFAADHPDFAVIGVAVRDQLDAARALADELSPGYPVGFDATERLRDQYVGFGMPATFVIDRQGVVIRQFDGPVTAEDLAAVVNG